MEKLDKLKLLSGLEKLINDIPAPPPGREMALVKTKLDEARLWLKEELTK